MTANITAYDTEIKDFQTQVTNASVGVLRGYLANAEKVRVRGAELDANAQLHRNLSLYGAVAYTDGRYLSFPDAPPPLEETGGPASKDISGTVLPGISKWALSIGGEYAQPHALFGQDGQFFGAVDASYRSDFSSSASYSRYLVVDGYALLNARVGLPRDQRVDGLRLVAQSARQELLRTAHGGARQYRSLRGTAGRRADRGAHAQTVAPSR